jgi:sialidase-1
MNARAPYYRASLRPHVFSLRALALVSLVVLSSPRLPAAPQFSLFDVWTPANSELDGDLTNGPEPHFIYAIGVTWNDTILVACEGRLAHTGDGGAKYLLVKRSTDQGATWSGDIVLEGGDGASWTNPAFVTDGVTTYVFYGSTLTGTKTLHYKTSTDNGQTWSTRQDINSLWGATFPNDWVQHGTIGHGIKKLKDPNRGRLLLAFNHRAADTTNAVTSKIGNDVLYHDPSGSWALAQGVQPPLWQETDGINSNDVGPGESRVAERANGTVVIIARKRWNTGTYTRSRVSGTSIANGVDWNNWADATGIIGCNFVDGGFIRFSDTCHLYSFPNNPGSSTRLNISVAASADGGVTWGTPQLIYGGETNYSDLARWATSTVSLAATAAATISTRTPPIRPRE